MPDSRMQWRFRDLSELCVEDSGFVVLECCDCGRESVIMCKVSVSYSIESDG